MKSSLNSKTQSAGTNVRAGATGTRKNWKSLVWKQRWLLLMALPGFLIVLVFNYFPMYGYSLPLNRELKIKYELIPGSEYSDKASILFSTGDFGDLIGIPFLFDYSKASEEGFLLDIAPYKDIFPNYWKYMEQTSAGIATTGCIMTDHNGLQYPAG